MSQSSSRSRKALSFVALVFLVVALTLAGSGAALGEGTPYQNVPGYPQYGCYDVVSAGMGMYTGNALYPLVLWVPGPVVDAYLVWIGTEDVGAPNAPDQSDLIVNGTTVLGDKVDSKSFAYGAPWYMWRANVGPAGYNLVQQGYNSLNISGWFAVPEGPRRNGVSLVVVYDTGACVRPNKVELLDTMDWYYEGTPGEGTSGAMVFEFPPAPEPRSVRVWLHHAGTDHTNPCRPEQVWAAVGSGTPPANIINYGMPSTGVNGGAVILTEAFSPLSCGGTTYPPVTYIDGGWIDPEWSVVELKIDVPAGATYLVLQAESVMTGDPDNPGESGVWFGQAVIPLYNPELRISKTDGVDLAAPGDQLTYTLSYENYGYGPAQDVIIVDTLPDYVSYVSATGDGVYDAATHTVTWNIGTLAASASGQVAVTVKLDPVFEAGTTTLTNVATISTTTPGEQDTTDNTTSDQTDVFAQVELTVSKVATPDPVDAGGDLTYTVNWTVGGNAYARGVTIVDTLPSYVTFVSATGGGLYNPLDRTVTWLLGDVTPVTSGSYQVSVRVQTPLYNGTQFTNTVVISDDAGNTDEDSFTSTVRSSHQLVIEKLAAPEPVDAGGQLTYTINWAVTGNEPAKDAVIVDTLPAEVVAVLDADGGTYDPVAHTITWELGELMTPQSGSFTVVVRVATPLYNGTQFVNTVDFSDQTPGSTPVSASVTSTVRSSHELAIEKLAAPEPVDAGGQLTYTINWAVTGNEPAKDAVIVDTLPAEVVAVLDADGGTYDPVAHTITWELGELMTPQSGSFTVVVRVATPLYNGTQFVNTVDFSDQTPGSTPVSASVTSTVRSDHELFLTKADSPDPVEKGAELTYLLSWRVTGNEPADNVVLVDTLPFGTQFVSASDGGVFDPVTRTVTWVLGNKVPGDMGAVLLVVRVNRDFPNGLPIQNVAVISDDKPGKEKRAFEDTEVVQTPEGSIGDTVWIDLDGDGVQGPGEPGIPGVGLILYDAGPDGLCGTADDVAKANTVTDANGKYVFSGLPAGTYCVDVIDATVPAGLTLVSGSDPHGPVTLTEGQVYRDADFGYGGVLGVIGDRVWSDANGNGVQDPGEVGIEGVTLNLLNAGPDGLCGTADDTVVASTTTGPAGNYLFAGLVAGKYCVKVTDLAGVLTGAVLTGGTDPHGPIDLAAGEIYLDADFGYQVPACAGQIGNLVFYDTNRNGVFEPGLGEVGIPGVTISLLAGDTTVATVITDANGNYLFSGLCDGDYQVVVTDLNGRLVGYTQTYGLPNTDNHGQVSPFSVTIVGGSSVLYADFAYADGHLLTVSKTNNIPFGQPVEAGAEMVYTISYSVSGRENAPNVVLRDMLPMQVEFVAASDGGVYDAALRVVTWSLGDLAPGSSGSVTLTVRVKKPLPNNSYIFNTVIISDDAGVMDEATDVVRVHAEPILSLEKTNTPTGTVQPGNVIEYRLCFANTGNGNATNVVLTDMIPAFTTYVEGSANPPAAYDPAARTLTWNLGTLGPDVSACGTFQVRVDLTIPGVTETPQNWTVDNIAHLDSTEKPRLTASTSNPLNAFVRPTLTKTAAPPGEVKPGDRIKYTVCFGNEGNANLTGVVLTDVIPVNTTYVAGSATPTAVYDETTRTLTWDLGILGPNASGCGSFDVTVNMTIVGLTGQAHVPLSFAEWTALTITNVATLKTDQVPDKTAQVSNPLNATVKPEIYKSVNKGQVFVATGIQETIVYTVTVVNNGTANATDVVITDAVHPRLQNPVVTATKGTVTYDPVVRVWTVTVGTLAPGETVLVTITAKTEPVPPDALVPFYYDMANIATVSFQEGAPRNSNQVVVRVVAVAPEEIPEPGTLLLLGTGLAGLAGYARMRAQARRRRNG